MFSSVKHISRKKWEVGINICKNLFFCFYPSLPSVFESCPIILVDAETWEFKGGNDNMLFLEIDLCAEFWFIEFSASLYILACEYDREKLPE